MNAFEKKDLLRMTSEPLNMQYQRILAKLMEAYQWTDGDILICFSGGKDSALILDMWCWILQSWGKTDKPVQVAFANTTNETTAMNKYVPWFIERCEKLYRVKIDFKEIKPLKLQNIITVLRNEGLPFISKMVSATIRKVTADMEAKGILYSDIKDLHHPTIECRDRLREMGLSNTTVLALTGWSCRRNDFGTGFVLPDRWMPLLDIKRVTGKNIRLTEKCCQILKKEPISRLKHENIMTGEQAVESKSRESQWLKNGCNYHIDGYKGVRSKPLGAVSLDAVLFAIKERDIPLCSDYGVIEELPNPNGDFENPCFRCTKAGRTGCALCGFGIKFDQDRFIRLQETDPAKVNIAFKPMEQGGLGYLETCEFLNEYCRTKIAIPKL